MNDSWLNNQLIILNYGRYNQKVDNEPKECFQQQFTYYLYSWIALKDDWALPNQNNRK